MRRDALTCVNCCSLSLKKCQTTNIASIDINVMLYVLCWWQYSISCYCDIL